MQAEERMTFNYPPFCRMVKISIKHKDRPQLNYFSDMLGRDLKEIFGKRVLWSGIAHNLTGAIVVYQDYPSKN